MAQGWLAGTRSPPAHPLTPSPPPFLDNFLEELEKLGALTLAAHQAKPDIPEETLLEIREEPSAPLPPPVAPAPARPPSSQPPFPGSGVTWTTAQPYEAAPLQGPRKTTQNKCADLAKTRKGFAGPERAPEVLGDKCVASAHTDMGPLPQTLPAIGEEDEEICEGVASGTQGGPESQAADALWWSPGNLEGVPHLHIEEEEEERKCDGSQGAAASPPGPRAPEEDGSAAQASPEVFPRRLIPEELTSLTTTSRSR